MVDLQSSIFFSLSRRLFSGRKQRRKAVKAEAHAEQFASQWRHRHDAFARRDYASYADYLAHQASKLDAAYERRAKKDEQEVRRFRHSFAAVAALAQCRNVLCLGARLGAEVKALRELGYFAVGLDLNPGADNAYVHYGDFHQLPFHDHSVDAVYTNALDHVFDLARLAHEVHRVLRCDGLFIADVTPGFAEGFVPGKYEATYWRRTTDLVDAIQAADRFATLETKELGFRGRNPWSQVIFRKVAAQGVATLETAAR